MANIIAFLNNARETFVKVRTVETSVDFLTMRSGTIDIETVDMLSDLGRELKPAGKASQNLVKIAEQLGKSVLPKSPRAISVLTQIKANTDPERTDFVTAADENLDKLASRSRTHRSGGESKPKAKKEKKVIARKAEGMFSLADLARELNLDPREVRAKFRKANIQKPDIGWAWPTAKRAEILKMVNGGGDVKAKADKPVKAAKTTSKPAARAKAAVPQKKVRVNLKAANKSADGNQAAAA